MDDNLRRYLDALSIQETGWDNNKVVGTNNVYNIKDFTGGGTRAFDKVEKSNDAYRNFGSREEADNYMVGMLGRKYPGALEAKSIEDFTTALRTGGYATDPNHAKGIISIYNRKYGQQSPEVAPVAQTYDFSPFENKYGDKIKTARAQGVADADIARTIDFYENQEKTAAANRAIIDAGRPQAEREVAARVARSGSPIDGVAYLGTIPGFKEEVAYAQGIGKSDEEILQKLAPGGMVGIQAYQKRKGTSAIKDVWDGLVDQLESYALGTRQLLNFDPERERQLLAEEQARRMDPERIALNNTYGAAVGGILPDVAVGALTGGSGLVGTAGRRIALAGVEGAISGGLQPIVEGENRAQNAMIGAGMSAATGGLIEGAVKYAPKVSDRIRDALKQREVPLQDDIRARVVSQRIASDQGVPLSSPYIDEKWVAETWDKLSKEYDDILKDQIFVMPDEYRAKLMDPNFRKNFTSSELEDVDQLLYETVMQRKVVPKQALNPDGTVKMEPHQRIVRDANGRPIKENYEVEKFYDIPRTETGYAPRTEYQQQPPKMRMEQVVGPDGNVETQTRRRVAYLPDGNLPPANLKITTYKDGDQVYRRTNLVRPTEPYQVPKMEYQQFPGNSVRTQVRDEAGNVVMDPKRVKVRDDQGNVVMEQASKVLNKTRTKMQARMVPSSEYVEIGVPVQVPRQNPLPLRDAHNLVKNVNGKFNQLVNAEYVDAFKRDAMERLRDIADDAFYAGSSVDPQKIKNLNYRYGQFSVTKDAFQNARADGTSIGETKHWENALAKNKYQNRLVKGVAPQQDVMKALQENTRELDRVARGDRSINELSNMGATAGFAMGSPKVGALAGGARLLGKVVNNARSNPNKGIDKLVPFDVIKQIQQAAEAQLPVNAERRIQNTGGTKRATDKTVKVLKKSLERKMVIPVYDSQSDE